ncbi:MAG: hypothetical protein H7Z74_01905 [Anaerolineae bacterium]|nr:hypothetical protein [Gemmatimonadaceae bacterium]
MRRCTNGLVRCCWICLVLALSAGEAALAQGRGTLFERLNLDQLRLTAVGAMSGQVYPSRVVSTQAYAVQADYGEITRHWRVVFTVSYWGSEFEREVVEKFEQRLLDTMTDPAGDDTLRIGRINVSDISLETDLRWAPRPVSLLRPYLGGAFGAHVINAESPFIADTFVESALDNIAAGIAGVAGLDIAPIRALTLGVQGRYTLLSNTRFLTFRAGGSYHFNVRQPLRSP